MAAFVLFSAAAPAGIVCADFSLTSRLIPNIFAPVQCCLLRDPGSNWLLSNDRLDPIDRMHDVVLDVNQQRLEHVVSLGLVDDEWILLSICLKSNTLSQIIHRCQMLDPQPIYHGQHDVSLD